MSALTSQIAALDRLLALTVLLAEDMTKSLAQDGLTVSRAHLLWELHHHGPRTQQAIARALKVSPRNVTGLVDGLVATGHVTREPHPTDRRATLVTLTTRGATVIAEMEAGQRKLAADVFGGMTDGELDTFIASLDKTLTRLNDLVVAAAGQPASARAVSS